VATARIGIIFLVMAGLSGARTGAHAASYRILGAGHKRVTTVRP
jgi:hypothetical protein